MQRTFNVTGLCTPARNYMVDISGKVEQIVREYILPGKYFTINRARQFGKTTMLNALAEYLRTEYIVVNLDFQTVDALSFKSTETFVAAFAEEILDNVGTFPEGIEEQLSSFVEGTARIRSLNALFRTIKDWCGKTEKGVVLIIDEVDSASNNQVFLDFLSQLRAYYLKRPQIPAFQSVILAGVYDIKNLKKKIRPGEETGYNSPWNIAADFTVDMSFSADDIASMLLQYETDWNTGMDVEKISRLLYDYTSGYPFLVSRLCQIMARAVTGDSSKAERARAWGEEAFQDAVREIVKKPNMLFDDMTKKLADYPKLKEMIYGILFQGKKYSYEPENERIRIGEMFGFLKERDGQVCVSNRIFEMKLYNLFLSEDETETRMFTAADSEKSQFIRGGHLQMELVLQKFCEYFEEIYSDADDTFIEDNGRRIFLIFLKPIINGSGNYYIETRTRNMKRTDVIIDYRGVQHVIEMKIWHGQEYNRRGENQLLEYMEYYHLDKGYMLSFNFNREKETGIRTIQIGSKVLVEAVV
ncbi:MAG: AAA-like domain-containing protein [Lachnospiraceae bacterium]|nr:AAA-like domain-containing protein [Lachnospiraceae bacterium]